MKYVLLGGVVVGFGMIGLTARSHLVKRQSFYRELIDFIEHFIVNVNFLQVNFLEYIQAEIAKNNELKEILESFQESSINGVDNPKIKSSILTDGEVDEVKDLLMSIGSTDTENQIALLKGYKIKVEAKYLECSEFVNKYAGFAVKISFIVGALAVLIFI